MARQKNAPTRYLTHPDTMETKKISDWAKEMKIHPSTLHKRLKTMTLRRALTKGPFNEPYKRLIAINHRDTNQFHWPAPRANTNE